MSGQTAEIESYKVHIGESGDDGGTLVFTFTPKDDAGGMPQSSPRIVVAVMEGADRPSFDWSQSPDTPESTKEEIESEIRDRLTDRANWINCVESLVDQVEEWAREMDWSTRRIEKKIEDRHIGTHRVPALLMQEELIRMMLEPLGPGEPSIEGTVDLYLMPAYDDIARLFYENDGWNVYFLSNTRRLTTSAGEDETVPLSKGILEDILAEMKKNAA